MIKNLDHLNMTVKNFDEARDWYKKIFDMQLVEVGIQNDRPWGILRGGDAMLCLYENPDYVSPETEMTGHSGLNHFAFTIDDVEKWKRKILDHGLETYYDSPVQYSYSQSWYVKNPSGYMIEVASWNEGKPQFAPIR